MSEPSESLDLIVIGGGINGAGIAADAAGRGLSVLLCEQHDLAAHTSSASSKLIHGGLRYLEHYEFRLVREALAEREVLLGKAPHLVRPLRFVLPHRPHLRPAWLIRTGLFLYDHLGRRQRLPASRSLRLGSDGVLQADIRRAFEYSDCWADDARLVVANAMAAAERGAQIHTRCRCIAAQRRGPLWQVELEDAGGQRRSVHARALVNAAGPWVARLLREALERPSPYGVRLVQGSHLVVPRLHNGEHAYILQHEDGRIVFVIPYLEHFSLIGTTDREYRGDPARVQIDDSEIDYLLNVVNGYFRQTLRREDILHCYSGVRPLCDDESSNPSAITRDYTLALDSAPGQAPLLSVFGGKLTTYRRLAEAALARLAPWFPHLGPAWTATAVLPGGEGIASAEDCRQQLLQRHPWLPEPLARRWSLAYGSRSEQLLNGAACVADLGPLLGGDLYTREVDYLCAHEWANSSEDVLWRRSKLGLFLDEQARQRLACYLGETARSPSLTSR